MSGTDKVWASNGNDARELAAILLDYANEMDRRAEILRHDHPTPSLIACLQTDPLDE